MKKLDVLLASIVAMALPLAMNFFGGKFVVGYDWLSAFLFSASFVVPNVWLVSQMAKGGKSCGRSLTAIVLSFLLPFALGYAYAERFGLDSASSDLGVSFIVMFACSVGFADFATSEKCRAFGRQMVLSVGMLLVTYASECLLHWNSGPSLQAALHILVMSSVIVVCVNLLNSRALNRVA